MQTKRSILRLLKHLNSTRHAAFVALFMFLSSNSAFAEQARASEFGREYKSYIALVDEGADELALAAIAQKLSELSASKFGKAHKNTINLVVSAANHYRNAKDFSRATALYDDALGLYEEADLQQSKDYMLLMAEVLKPNFEITYQDRERLTRDLTFALRHHHENNQSKLDLALSLAVFNTIVMEGRTSRSNAKRLRLLADSIFEKAEQILESDDIRLVESYFIYAKLMNATGRKDDAMDFFYRVIDTTSQAVDFTHPYELASHAQLVGLYESKRDSESATQHCLAIGKMKPWSYEVEPTPLYRENPDYPIEYARRNREGWVLISFDITPSGFVNNLKVEDSKGGSSFESAALRALSKWRYAPKFEDGKAVLAEGLQVRLDFSMGKRERSLKNI